MHWRGLRTPSVFTIHNLAYQGNIDMSLRRSLGIPGEACSPERMEFYGKLSLLKAGIAYARRVTTVSATYAREITTSEFGCGMDESWEPEDYPHLIQGFGVHEWAREAATAAQAREHFGLTPSNGPLFAVVSRLVRQKGLDLTIGVARNIVEAGGQLAILGCGE